MRWGTLERREDVGHDVQGVRKGRFYSVGRPLYYLDNEAQVRFYLLNSSGHESL